jgi:hypothetical protein
LRKRIATNIDFTGGANTHKALTHRIAPMCWNSATVMEGAEQLLLIGRYDAYLGGGARRK